MKITICGGGSLGHVCAGVLSSRENVDVNLLTGHPQNWTDSLTITDPDGKKYHGHLSFFSDDAESVIPESDIVLLCLPGYQIEKTLCRIKPYLGENTIVGTIVSSTGFFFFAHEILGPDAKLFGFQRVPYIARVSKYGESANLLGYKSHLNVAVENVADPEGFRQTIETLFDTKTSLLDSFYEAALTNSNPILHTGRLYSMWGSWNGEVYDRCSLFYKEWTVEAAQILIDMDREFKTLLTHLPMNPDSIPSLLDYYESTDAQSLCNKLSSIPAFLTIKSPMKEVDGGWVPDFDSRYFTEDFPFGLRFIVELAGKYDVQIPTIDMVYEWGIGKCKKD